MLVASGTLISPETQSLRVLPKPLGLATKSMLRAGDHVSLCWCLLPALSINYPSSAVPDLHLGKEERDTQCWAVCRRFHGCRHVRMIMKMVNSIGARVLSPPML